MRSGSLPKSKSKSKLKTLSFADAVIGPTPEEIKARERVDARKRQSKQPEEGNKEEEKKEPFVIRQSFDNIGRELISLVATALREIGKKDIAAPSLPRAPTKADSDMLLPLAQKMSKVFGRCEDLTVKTEFVEGLGNTYGFDMSRKEALDTYLTRVLYYNCHVLPRETISG